MLGALPAPPSAPSMQRRKICMWGEAGSVLGTFGSRLGVGTEVKSGPVVSCSLSSVTVHVHWYAWVVCLLLLRCFFYHMTPLQAFK